MSTFRPSHSKSASSRLAHRMRPHRTCCVIVTARGAPMWTRSESMAAGVVAGTGLGRPARRLREPADSLREATNLHAGDVPRASANKTDMLANRKLVTSTRPWQQHPRSGSAVSGIRQAMVAGTVARKGRFARKANTRTTEGAQSLLIACRWPRARRPTASSARQRFPQRPERRRCKERPSPASSQRRPRSQLPQVAGMQSCSPEALASASPANPPQHP